IHHQVLPQLTVGEARVLRAHLQQFVALVETAVSNDAMANPPEQEFSVTMTPLEYEQFCARALRRGGWNATVTRSTGDQGADVVAEKNGVRVVLQCKLYTQPV